MSKCRSKKHRVNEVQIRGNGFTHVDTISFNPEVDSPTELNSELRAVITNINAMLKAPELYVNSLEITFSVDADFIESESKTPNPDKEDDLTSDFWVDVANGKWEE